MLLWCYYGVARVSLCVANPTLPQVKILEANITIEKQARVVLESENSDLRQKIDVLSHQLDPCMCTVIKVLLWCY